MTQCASFSLLYWFQLQYFDCLPLKESEFEFHSDVKMISDSVRIFFTFILVSASGWGGGIGVSMWGGVDGGDWG